MAAPVTITLTNRLAELERVSGLVTEFAQRCGLPATATFEITLALDELLTNVISYAYDDGQAHQIAVRLRHDPGAVAVEIEDDGRPFNPLDVPPPDLEQPIDGRAVGGLGIHLVREVMDDLAYQRRQGKNVLVMTKSVSESC